MMELFEVKEEVELSLLAEKGIAGVGIGSSRPKLRVYVETEADARKVPKRIGGFDVEVVVSGRFRALSVGRVGEKAVDKLAKVRPAVGGVSIGHYKITAGTLGCVVRDSITGERLILSNNHVLAASNQGKKGDPIYQPGPYDGGDETCEIARLDRFVRIIPHGVNLVDAAAAKPIRDEDVSEYICDIGYVNGIEDARVDMRVAKSGRTTCYTEGRVLDVHATVKVYGYPFGYAIFKDQIITTKLAEGGDSGSLVINLETKRAVGLLFAGSDRLTVCNKIGNVCKALRIDIAAPHVRPRFPFLIIFPGLVLFEEMRK